MQKANHWQKTLACCMNWLLDREWGNNVGFKGSGRETRPTYWVKLWSGSLGRWHIDELWKFKRRSVTSIATGVEAYFPSTSEDPQDNAGLSANASVPLHRPKVLTNQDQVSEHRYPHWEHHPPDRYSSQTLWQSQTAVCVLIAKMCVPLSFFPCYYLFFIKKKRSIRYILC